MTDAVPREVLHIFEYVKKAKRFSIFPKALDERFTSDQSMHRYVAACRVLFDEAKSTSIFDLSWAHEKPSFSQEHSILEMRLDSHLARGENSKKYSVLKNDSSFDEVEFLWSRRAVKGILKCAIVMKFSWPSSGLIPLFACSSEPTCVTGANTGLRIAINHAKKIAMNEGSVAVLFRGREIEVFASDLLLPELFTCSYKNSGQASERGQTIAF